MHDIKVLLCWLAMPSWLVPYLIAYFALMEQRKLVFFRTWYGGHFVLIPDVDSVRGLPPSAVGRACRRHT